MRVTAESYRMAALEHLDAARALVDPRSDRRRYALANYLAGLSVECILRAYSFRVDPGFESRHDIRKWYTAARFDAVVPAGQRRSIDAAAGVIVAHWNNSQRYYSGELLRAYFKQAELDRGLRGNVVKELTRRTVDAALEIVTLGEKQWKNSLRVSKTY